MAATAFHRLAYYGNAEFGVKAERYKSSAITGLLRKAHGICGTPNSWETRLSAIAVIMIMIYDDMVSAQNYFRILAPILRNLYYMMKSSDLVNDCLGTFLAEQMGLLLVLCLPYFDPGEEQRDMATEGLKFLDDFASRSDRHPNASFLAYCLRLSVSVWLQKAEDPYLDLDPTLESFKSQLQDFRDLTDLDHYLTWVYFNCAAASMNEQLRQFFANHLEQQMQIIGFKNIPLMLQLLQRLWKDDRSWPSTLQQHHEYICA
ncbi:hypothetical protein B0A52_06605 [Exophiala mesophila]|uniref:Uncharacterized protein n=1 Tax=Exophiala mesophila TaxID=212818 RepID=A0A438N1D9_EXOME|nr:hypothetical protein B0A52_06605 [Exophiala mesophila]